METVNLILCGLSKGAKIKILQTNKLYNSSKLLILVFFRLIMPYHVLIISAMPNNKAEITSFSNSILQKTHEKSHEYNFKQVDQPSTLASASPPSGF